MRRSRTRFWKRIGFPAAAGLVALAGAPACRQTPEPPKPPETRAAPRVLVFAPGLPPLQAPGPEPMEPPPEPTAAYPSLSAACDAVERLMVARLAVAVRRVESVNYQNEFLGAHRTGCELSARGKRSMQADTVGSRDSDGDLADGLVAAGWVDIPRYTADGPDGSAFGMRSRETVCLFRASWDGGDDSDSTYVPSDDWDLIGHCAPQQPGDSV